MLDLSDLGEGGSRRIEQLVCVPYEIPLRRRWANAHGEWRCRRGWLIVVNSEGQSGYGDCAPLPAAGTEEHERARETLELTVKVAHGQTFTALSDWMEEHLGGTPATRYALECAMLDVMSRSQGRTLRHLLVPTAADSVPVNAVLGALTMVTPEDVRGCLAAGFSVVKIKVGMERPSLELARIRELVAEVDERFMLRLDANGAWCFDEARRFLDGLSSLSMGSCELESLEEPLSAPDPERLRTLQDGSPCPLALDEHLLRWLPHTPLPELGVRRIVIKPAVIGGLQRSLHLFHQARQAGLQAVMTSILESAAGLWPTAQLAAAAGNSIAQGLATAGWLAQDLGKAPEALLGRIALSEAPGSGFHPWGLQSGRTGIPGSYQAEASGSGLTGAQPSTNADSPMIMA